MIEYGPPYFSVHCRMHDIGWMDLNEIEPGTFTDYYWNARVSDVSEYLSRLDPDERVHVIRKSSRKEAD